jgi:hypothetical protein
MVTKMQILQRFVIFYLFVEMILPLTTHAETQQENLPLLKRIERLEKTVADLQKKIADLQNTKQSDQVANQNIQKQELWKIKENWRKLRIGMSMDEVRLLLGEPVKVNSISIGVYWYYAYCISSCNAGDSHVYFRRNLPFGNADPVLRVESWSE